MTEHGLSPTEPSEPGAPADLGKAPLGPGLRAGLLMLRVVSYLLVAMVAFAFVVRLVR